MPHPRPSLADSPGRYGGRWRRSWPCPAPAVHRLRAAALPSLHLERYPYLVVIAACGLGLWLGGRGWPLAVRPWRWSTVVGLAALPCRGRAGLVRAAGKLCGGGPGRVTIDELKAQLTACAGSLRSGAAGRVLGLSLAAWNGLYAAACWSQPCSGCCAGLSAAEQHRQIRASRIDLARGAAEDDLAQPRVPVGAHHQQVGTFGPRRAEQGGPGPVTRARPACWSTGPRAALSIAAAIESRLAAASSPAAATVTASAADQKRHRVLDRPGRLARAVPGDHHPPADRPRPDLRAAASAPDRRH